MPFSDHPQEVRNYYHGSGGPQHRSSFSQGPESFYDEGEGSAGMIMVADPVLSPPVTSSRASRLCRRPGMLCVILGLLLVGVAVAVGVAYSSVATRSFESSNAAKEGELAVPTASPAPTMTLQPTPPNPCPVEYQSMQDCLGNRAASVACQSCVIQYWPQKVDNCTDIDDETCTAFRQCDSCGSCDAEVETYIECLSGCTLDCPSPAPTASPGPTPAPAPLCPDEYAAFDSCVDPINGGDPCEKCIATSYWASLEPTCEELYNGTCAALAPDSSCPCNGCTAETIALLVCLSECDSWECATGGGRKRRLPERQQLSAATKRTRTTTTTRLFADYWNGAQ